MIFTNPDELYAQLTEQEKQEIEEVRLARQSGKTPDQIYQIVREQELSNPEQTHFTIPPSLLDLML